MSRRKRKSSRPAAASGGPTVEVPDPVDVVDGIPDRSSRPRGWKYAALAAVFIGWLAFLIYCALAGSP